MKWIFPALLRVIKKRKGKVVWMYITNKRFRKQINTLKRKIDNKDYILQRVYVSSSRIKESHDIVYSEWVVKLATKINAGYLINPIEIVRDDDGDFYIADGHHRFTAWKMSSKSGWMIPAYERVYI